MKFKKRENLNFLKRINMNNILNDVLSKYVNIKNKTY